MFRHFFLIALRYLNKNRLYSLINILGMSVGLTGFILLSLFLNFYSNFEDFHENLDRIYQVEQYSPETGYEARTPYPLSDELMAASPDIVGVTRHLGISKEIVLNNIDVFVERGIYAESSFFDVLTFPFIEGNKEVLKESNSIILTESLALKYYNEINVIGRSLIVDGQSYEIAAIIEDVPKNSGTQFDFIIPFSKIAELNDWNNSILWTYILLNKKENKAKVESRIESIINEHVDEEYKNDLFLKPLEEIALKASGDNKLILIVIATRILSLFILFIGCINFIQLMMAFSTERIKEIGVKRLLGSSKIKVYLQFIGESLILTFIAINFSFVLSETTLPLFNRIFYCDLEINYFSNPSFMFYIIGIALLAGIIAGIYPSITLVKLKPKDALKGSSILHLKKIGLKKIMVIFQFAIAIFLIIGSVVLEKQVAYMKNMDKGFDTKNILTYQFQVKPGMESKLQKIKILKNKLSDYSGIKSVSITSSAPFIWNNDKNIILDNGKHEKKWVRWNEIDIDFLNTYNLKLTQGEGFHKNNKAQNLCVINETLAKSFDKDMVIGETLDGGKYTVAGVMKDFHYHDINWKINPLVMILRSDSVYENNVLSIRVKPEKKNEIISIIKEETRLLFPGSSIEYNFSEELINYSVVTAIGDGFLLFAILTILISIIGVFALVSYIVKRQTKEIGIRKVLGGTAHNIFQMILWKFVRIFIIAFLIASPLAYLAVGKLLQIFDYRISITPGVFIFSGLLAFLTIFLTIYVQAQKAANTNPVKNIRYE